jgi:8-oxo-dGTP diphosphatase
VVIYDGGVLSAGEIAAINVPEEELDGFAFVPPDRAEPVVERRIQACLKALRTGEVAALDNGGPVS